MFYICKDSSFLECISSKGRNINFVKVFTLVKLNSKHVLFVTDYLSKLAKHLNIKFMHLKHFFIGVIIGGMLISCGGNKSSEGDNGDSMSISEAVGD